MNISVIIPAYNAAATLEETIKSLQAQTLPQWEAIIIDDGSQDETAAIASDPSLDIIHCGWTGVSPDGKHMGEKSAPNVTDLFPQLSRYCPFAIHAIIIRKALVEATGGFDLTIPTCEEWDLWQREGHFTVQLAPLVEDLIAADISQVALERNAQRCGNFKHIKYQQIDLVKDSLPGQFNLIICSEVLYFVGSLAHLKNVAEKFADALNPNGYLIMAHAHQIADEPDKPGFDWGMEFGAKAISDTFANVPLLYLAKEIWTPLYRVQLFRRYPSLRLPWQNYKPEIIKIDRQPTAVPQRVETTVRWQGGQPSKFEYKIFTEKLPILMYHRVAPSGSEKMGTYRVTPEAFEEQLRYLKDAGFYSVSWEQWQLAQSQKQPLPGRGVMITFDDGYLDFFEYAWPLLKKYSFTATVFLVADLIGKSNTWDQAFGEEISLMEWPEIQQLQKEGVEFGSHSANHKHLTAITNEELVQELARSRTILQRGLGVPIRTIAYPYGDFNPIVEHFTGGCGYTFGVTCRSGLSQFSDRLLALPRLEVMGNYTLQEFVNLLSR